MHLECTVVAGPAAPTVAAAEITVRIPGDGPVPGTAVRDALAARWPGVPFTVDGQAVEDLSAGVPPLVSGAVLVAGGAPRSPGCGPAPVLLAVLSGPGAGAVLPLRRGRYRVGRGRVELSIADPSLSRHHLTVAVDREGITLVPADGSRVEVLRPSFAAPLRLPSALQVGDVVNCGHTQLAVRLAAAPPDAAGLDGTPAGYSLGPPGDPLQVPRPGGPARNAGGLLAMAALPLVGGLVLAWVTRSWMFLGFAALSALTGVIPLLTGRRHRREFRTALATAVAEDRRRRLTAHPPPGEACLAHAAPATTPVAPPGAPPVAPPVADPVALPGAPPVADPVALPGAVPHVRLGTARLPANVMASPADRSFLPPLVQGLPMVVPVPPAGLEITGAPALAAGLWNFLLIQVAGADAGVVVRGPVGSFLPSVRFLPGVAAEVTGGGEPMIVLPSGAVIRFRPAHHHSGATVLELSCRGEQPAGTVTGTRFVPDGVPDAVFDRYARRCAARAARRGPAATVLASVPIPGPGCRSAEAVRTLWSANRGRRLTGVVIGQGRRGPEFLDLSRDGPHLLVGGTTGAGKSEFLRTLAGSLAAAHSPADLAFVYLDFKGGAALGPLAAFPHTSCLLTDLDEYAMERTLASLRTEIQWREAVLAGAGASDLDEFRQKYCADSGTNVPVGHLVVVVDEFRVLVDQHPQAMAELIRCASVGRSLGIHLVLATQRPQGAISSDIRANVTSAICLRVQSTLDSQDVLGTGQAAAIATTTPGRAFLRRAGMAPTEFQSGSLGSGNGPERRAVLEDFPAPGGQGQIEVTSSTSDVPAVAALLADAWTGWNGWNGEPGESGPREAEIGRRSRRASRPGRPSPVVAPALPEVIELPPGRDIQLGLVDIPRQQRLGRLCWSPARHSHLACIGPLGSGAPEALALIVRQLAGPGTQVGAIPEWFLYLLDGDGSLAGSLRPSGALLPTGTVPSSQEVGSSLGIGEVRAAARLVRRLAEVGNDGCARMLLCISGWGHWVGAFRNSPWPEAEDMVADLARIQGGNLVLAVSGERELLNARFMASVPNRLYFPHGASMESRVAWPRLPGFKPIPGRAAGSGPAFAEAAAARGRETSPPSPREGGRRKTDGSGSPAAWTEATGSAAGSMEELFVAQTAQEPPFPAVVHRRRCTQPDGTSNTTSNTARPGSGSSHGAAGPPLRLASLPARLAVAQVLAAVPRPVVLPGTGTVLQLLLGLGGDGAAPVKAAVAPHGLLLALGGPGTGKSTFLEAVAALNPAALAGGTVQLVDDIDQLDPVRLEALRCAVENGAVVLATAANEARALLRLPAGLAGRNPAQGIVLRPRRPHDGDLLGVRLDVGATEPPGRAVLVDHGLLEWFQFPDMERPAHSPTETGPG